MSFSMEKENKNKLSFLVIEIIREQGKFTITIYKKPTVEKKAFAPSPSVLRNNIFGIITTASIKRCPKFLQTRNHY